MDTTNAIVSLRDFQAYQLKSGTPAPSWLMNEMLSGSVVGLDMPDVVDAKLCDRATALAITHHREQVKKYEGAADNLAEVLGISHWGPRYFPGEDQVRAWANYFDAVDEWDQARLDLLKPVFGEDPLKIMVGVTEMLAGQKLERLVHPFYGRRMGAGLARFGDARVHLDDARFDIGLDIVGHVGVVLVLHAKCGAIQRAYRSQLAAPELDGPSRGNYDLAVPKGTEFVDIPSETGHLNFLNARCLHEVIDNPSRLTVAMHVVKARDGRFFYFA